LPLNQTPNRHTHGSNSRTRIFAHAALLCLLAAQAAVTPAQAGQTPARALITTASAVRLRESPDTSAAEVGRLQLGIVVEEVERSAEKSKVGSSEAFWHLVSAPGGVRGWVFGGLVAPFDPARREETYLKLSSERLANTAATFTELSELFRFLDRARKEVKRRDALAELELTRLVALSRSLDALPSGEMEKPPYKGWTTEHEPQIVYSEPSGQWHVRADLFWDLQQKYRDLPLAERIAWQAAQTPLPGECEGYLPCIVDTETLTNGRYLKLYPRGAHAEAALKSISDLLGHVSEDLKRKEPVYEVPREGRAEFRKTLATLREQLSLVPGPKKARLLVQLDAIAQRFR